MPPSLGSSSPQALFFSTTPVTVYHVTKSDILKDVSIEKMHSLLWIPDHLEMYRTTQIEVIDCEFNL